MIEPNVTPTPVDPGTGTPITPEPVDGGATPEPTPPANPATVVEPTDGTPAPATTDDPKVNPDTGKPWTPEEALEKFSNSSSEANRLMDVLKQNNIDPKTGKPVADPTPSPSPTPPLAEDISTSELTEQDLEQAIPGYANMTDTEKNILGNLRNNTQVLGKIVDAISVIEDREKYRSEFKNLVKEEDFKILSEHKDDFKEFAYSKDNVGVKELSTVAKLFLQDKGLAKAPDPTPTPKPRPGVEPGGGSTDKKGANMSKTSYTAEEAQSLRKTDPQGYEKLVRAGKMNIA